MIPAGAITRHDDSTKRVDWSQLTVEQIDAVIKNLRAARYALTHVVKSEEEKIAEKIASMSKTTAIAAKQAVNRSFETTLEEGLLAEQNAFYALFATEDQTEGMSAFAEKRRPEWRR